MGGQASAVAHFAAHDRPHLHEADGSTVWLDGSAPIDPAQPLDVRALYLRLASQIGASHAHADAPHDHDHGDAHGDGDDGGDHPGDDGAPSSRHHEARGPLHFAGVSLPTVHSVFSAQLAPSRPLRTPEPARAAVTDRVEPGAPRGPPPGR